MSEMSNQNSENNGVNRLDLYGKVLRVAGVPWFESGDPVIINLLSEQSGLRRG